MSEQNKIAPSADEGLVSSENHELTPHMGHNDDGNIREPEVAKFLSEAPAHNAHMPARAPIERVLPPAQLDGDLAGFLKRPVKIITDSFVVNTAFNQTYDPWALFLNNAYVQSKINNFRFMRGTLHVSFQLNATPFAFGGFLTSYEPRNGERGSGAYDQSVTGDFRQHSCLPSVVINPCEQTVSNISCPFISPYSWVDLLDADGAQLGVYHIDTLSPLQYASASTDEVEFTVVAWMEDLEIAYPTVEDVAVFTPQGGDEYNASEPNAGVISEPLSRISEAAGYLTSIPFIGPFAQATEMIASFGSGVAKLFGYSKPRNLKAAVPYLGTIIDNMVNSDTADSSISLAVNSKNELSIDPRIIGFDSSEDELAVASLARRWTILPTLGAWAHADGPNTTLLEWDVNPFMGCLEGPVRLTALGFTAMPFSYWRGTIEVEITFLCSRYHRGRVRLYWEPETGGSKTGEQLNANYSRIVDIANNQVIRMKIPYVARKGYLGLNGRDVASAQGSNGTLRLVTYNKLSAPDGTVDVPIMVRVRGGDDIAFASPGEKVSELAAYYPQSVELGSAAAKVVQDITIFKAETSPEINQAFFADPVLSFRNLIKRYAYYTTVISDVQAISNNDFALVQIQHMAYPYQLGYTALSSASTKAMYSQLITGDGFNSTTTGILTYLEPAFLAKRGSMRWTMDPFSKGEDMGSNPESCWNVQRTYEDTAFNVGFTTYDAQNVSAGPVFTGAGRVQQDGSATGIQLYPQSQKGSRLVQFEIPFYNPKRYVTTFMPSTNTGNGVTQGFNIAKKTVNISGAAENTVFAADFYYAAGEDFTMNFFLGPPRYFRIDRAAAPYSAADDFFDTTARSSNNVATGD